jgi:hypothetical protein
MLAPISEGRRDSRTSFTKLKNYLTREKDPETGEEIPRGEVVLSDNLLSLETADLEMMGTANENRRNQEPVYHFQITWRPGERPTRGQWEEAAKAALKELGLEEHQYLIAAHDDRAHFHVHVMANKIHPETYKAHTPFYDMLTLDRVMRELEHGQGWSEDVGLFRWDNGAKIAIRNTREEMDALKGREGRASGKAGLLEHYNDVPSLQTYIKDKAALEVHALLSRQKVQWEDLHRTLAKHGLELHKAESGGYTVQATGTELRCKASDVFRRSFAGKANREAVEAKLGPWVEPTAADKQIPGVQQQYRKRREGSPERQASREQRQKERKALLIRFSGYRSIQQAKQKELTGSSKAKRADLSKHLKETKAKIRSQQIPWPEKRALLSQAIAQTVVEQGALKVEVLRERLADKPLTYQEWVAREAKGGDAAAAAQLRGWRYQDQRNARKGEKLIEGQKDAVHLSSASKERESDYSELMNDRFKELMRTEELTAKIKALRWSLNRRTGDVQYTVAGSVAIVDRGKTLSVLNSEESAIVLGLEMAVRKYGASLNVEGSQAWKDKVAKVAARNGVFVQFTDPAMQRTMLLEELRLHRYGVMAKQLTDLHARVTKDPQATFQLANDTAVRIFVSGLSGLASGKQIVEYLAAATQRSGRPEALTIKGTCIVESRPGLEGKTPIFTVRPLDGKGVQLGNMLKAGAAKMSALSESERSGRQRPLPQRSRQMEGFER